MRKRKKRKITKRQKLERIEKLYEKGIILRAIKSVKPTLEKQQEFRNRGGIPDRKNKHLNAHERGEIAALYQQGYSAYAIGKILNRASNTIRNELKRGTTVVIKNYYERCCYLPARGQAVYEANRKRSKRPLKATQADYQEFVSYVVEKVLKEQWSLDTARGRALSSGQFTKKQVVSVGTLYNYVDRGILPIKNIDLPVKPRLRVKKVHRIRQHKILFGRSIEERPQDISARVQFGHWEIDTVVGKQGKGAVLLTITERCTRANIIEKLESRSAEEVMKAMKRIIRRVPDFLKICKSITADNGSEFARLCELEKLGIRIYYAHPYSAYERGSNERNNREIRKYISKGKDIGKYSQEQIRLVENKLNTMPRRLFDYATAEELYNREVRRLI